MNTNRMETYEAAGKLQKRLQLRGGGGLLAAAANLVATDSQGRWLTPYMQLHFVHVHTTTNFYMPASASITLPACLHRPTLGLVEGIFEK